MKENSKRMSRDLKLRLVACRQIKVHWRAPQGRGQGQLLAQGLWSFESISFQASPLKMEKTRWFPWKFHRKFMKSPRISSEKSENMEKMLFFAPAEYLRWHPESRPAAKWPWGRLPDPQHTIYSYWHQLQSDIMTYISSITSTAIRYTHITFNLYDITYLPIPYTLYLI